MARGFLDDTAFDVLGGGDLGPAESFDPLQKSMDFIHEAELVMSEVAMLQHDLKEIWNSARDYGLDVEVLKDVIKRRKKSKAALEAHETAVAEIEMHIEGIDEDGEEIDQDERRNRDWDI